MNSYDDIMKNAWNFNEAKNERNLLLRWRVTYWCNYNCSYCFQHNHNPNQKLPYELSGIASISAQIKNKRFAHSFRNHTTNEWLNAFQRIGENRKIALIITGGEPFLDWKNFSKILQGLTEMDSVDNIRIDTNGSWKFEKYHNIDFSKIYLNISFHPEQIDMLKFFDQIENLQKFDINIAMINFVMSPNQKHDYLKLRDRFAIMGIKINANPCIDGPLPLSESDISYLKSFVKSFDLEYKCGIRKTKDKFCRYPMIGLQISPSGIIQNPCISFPVPFFRKKQKNFINAKKSEIENLLCEKPLKCPFVYCACLDKYSFLMDSDRNFRTLNTLKRYVEEAII